MCTREIGSNQAVRWWQQQVAGLGGGRWVFFFPAERANQQNVWKTWSESSVDMSQVDL